MNRNISPVLLVLQVLAVWLLFFAGLLMTHEPFFAENGFYAVLCFGVAALTVPVYQVSLWATGVFLKPVREPAVEAASTDAVAAEASASAD
jgi:hypothetical protein